MNGHECLSGETRKDFDRCSWHGRLRGVALAACVALALFGGCSSSEAGGDTGLRCGAGTTESNGECVTALADAAPADAVTMDGGEASDASSETPGDGSVDASDASSDAVDDPDAKVTIGTGTQRILGVGIPTTTQASTLSELGDAQRYKGARRLVIGNGVRAGPAAPWFGRPGGGTQYELPQSIEGYCEMAIYVGYHDSLRAASQIGSRRRCSGPLLD